MCVDLCLGHQFSSLDRHVWFSANGVLFLLDSSAIQLEIRSDRTSIIGQDCLSCLGFFSVCEAVNCPLQICEELSWQFGVGIVFGRMAILSVLTTIMDQFATDP